MARGGPFHDRRPHHGHRAAQLEAHRNGRRIRQSRGLSEARRGPSGVPAGLVRPARDVPRASTRRSCSMSYLDGFIVPVPEAGTDAYRSMAEMMGRKCKGLGALYYLEALGDDLQHGKVTDFYMAVKAEAGENVVFSFI